MDGLLKLLARLLCWLADRIDPDYEPIKAGGTSVDDD